MDDMEKTENHFKKPKRIWKLILILALTVCIVLVGYVCIMLYMEYTAGDIEPEQFTTPAATEPNTGPDRPKFTAPTDVLPKGEIDFDKLQKINKDLYAWVKIPNTHINYPVAQYSGDDNLFYLSHDMYKNDLFEGCIYTENYNKKDFSDPNTILYGHNMLNKTMFGDLHNFRDEEFFNENPYIYVYTPKHKLTYEIFSAYDYDDRHILFSFNFFEDKEKFAEYLEYAINPTNTAVRNTRPEVQVTVEDKIITLSTCSDFENLRYLVQGKLIKDEKVQ